MQVGEPQPPQPAQRVPLMQRPNVPVDARRQRLEAHVIARQPATHARSRDDTSGTFSYDGR